jgi:Tol biopolymer transport system component
VNIYNANSDGWCGFPYTAQQLDQTLSDLGPGKEVIRAWFFQSLATQNGQRDWSRFDRTIAAAGAHGMKVIVTLTDQWGECGDGVSGTPTGYKDASWYQTGYRTIIQPDALASYRDWVAEVVSRYKDNPTVAFWQLINEAEVNDVVNGQAQACPAGNGPADTLRSWAQDVGGLVKSIDSNHLVSMGTIGNGQCGAQSDQYQYVHDITAIDLCEYHDYGAPRVGIPGDQWNGLQRRIDQCNAINKPLFVGEAGIKPTDLDGTYTARADAFQNKVNAQTAVGVRGFLAWAWSANGSTPNNYDIGPADPALGSLIGPGHTERISVGNGGTQLNTWSETSRSQGISADGRYVAFNTQASLAPGDTNSFLDVYVLDRQTGSVEWISTTSTGGPGFGTSSNAVISSDGSTVAFMANAGLVPSDTNGDYDIYVRARGTPASIERVSVGLNGGNPNYSATDAAISATGRYVTFLSRASNLVADDTNGRPDVFLRDTNLDTTERVSLGSNGEEVQIEGTQGASAVSSDGRFVAINTAAPLEPADGNGKLDVYLRDRQRPSTTRVSEALGGGDAVEGGGDPSMSDDGSVIAFTGCSDDLVDNDSNGTCDVFDRVSMGRTRLLSVSTSGRSGNGLSRDAVVAADGSFAAFASNASDLVVGDTNGQQDVFAQDPTGVTVLASVSSTGAQGNASSFAPSVSSGGAVVVFGSVASNLVTGDTNGERDVFVRVFGGTAATVPEAPAAPTATAGDGSVDVSWAAPNDGGSPITAYTVRSSGGQSVTVGPSAFTAHIGGLTNGTSYTFTVVATNSVGDSQPSPPSNAVTPNATPNDPVSLGQFEVNGTTAIPVGMTTDGTTVLVKGQVSDPDGGQMRLEIELKPVGIAFDGTGLLQSPAVASGATAQVTVAGLSRDRRFHWRARSADSVNATSDWVSFGANAESSTDVRVEGRIVFSSNRQGANNGDAQEIYVMDPNGSNAIRLTTNTTIDTDPALSPDGTKIAFQSTRDGDYEIFVMNVDGSGVVQYTTNTAIDQSPAWSPDGTRIAFVSNRLSNGNVDVFVMNADGTNLTRLTTSAGTDGYPSWSPDGTKIAFMSPRDGDSEIFTMNANGTAQTQLTFNRRDDSFPAWSPDGTRIAFSSTRDASNNPDIYVMNANGTSPVRLTSKAGQDTAPTWSRDGSRILFQGIDTDSDWEIYRILANGTTLTKLTNNARGDVTPSW